MVLILVGVVSILFGGLTLVKGLQKYSLYFALSYLVPSTLMLYAFELNWASAYVVIGIISLMMFIFAKPFTYISGFYWLWLTGTLLIAMMSSLLLGDLSYTTIRMILFSCMVGSIVLTWMVRQHLKAIVIGLSGGFSISLGFAILYYKAIFGSRDLSFGGVLNDPLLPVVLVFVFCVLGVLFQYVYVGKKNPELVASIPILDRAIEQSLEGTDLVSKIDSVIVSVSKATDEVRDKVAETVKTAPQNNESTISKADLDQMIQPNINISNVSKDQNSPNSKINQEIQTGQISAISGMSVFSRDEAIKALKELQELRNAGIINEEEFNAKKERYVKDL